MVLNFVNRQDGWKILSSAHRRPATRRRGPFQPSVPTEVLESRVLLSAAALRVHDFNGDGFSDVAEMKADGEWWVGLSGADSFGPGSGLWADWADASAFVHVAFADFSGDLVDDVVGMDASGNWWVGVSTGSGFETSLWADWADAPTFAHVVVGEFNQAVGNDIAAMDTAGQWWVGFSNATGSVWEPDGLVGDGTAFVTRPEPWADWADASVWADIQIGQFDNNGTDDFAGMDASGNWWVTLTHQQIDPPSQHFETRTSLWADWADASAWSDIVVGNFNADLFDDIAGMDASGNWWVGITTGDGDDTLWFETSLWADWADAPAWADVLVLDFDGNTRDDIVGIDQGGNVWLGLNGAGVFMTGGMAAALGDASGWTQFQPLRTNDQDDIFPFVEDHDLAAFGIDGDWRVGRSTGGSVDAKFAFGPDAWADWDPMSAWATLDDDLRREIELDLLIAH